MPETVLRKKPLVEAIFEFRWELQAPPNGVAAPPGAKVDPHYVVFLGRIYEKVNREYPYHESLPTANMPAPLVAHVIQHRFRKAEGSWPLIQVGQGIITLNDTEGYVWKDFRRRINRVLNGLYASYPAQDRLKPAALILRYIDAIEFDFDAEDILEFFGTHMNFHLGFQGGILKGAGAGKKPAGFDIKLAFPVADPKGMLQVAFKRGKKHDRDALIWETVVQATGNGLPKDKEGVSSWANKAHKLTHDWFFKLIEGELRRRFE